jgi:hypothetical protein
MKLKALNKNTEKYGFSQTLEFNNPQFNGHQIGVAICIQNNITNKIEKNYLSETLGDEQTRDFLLGELLHESKAVFITENITQLDDITNDLVPKTIFYMPYFVEEHSRFKPTVINDNVSGAYNVYYDIEAELVFADDGLCRYLTTSFKTCNVPFVDLINDFFEYSDDEVLAALGIKWQEETMETDAGYALDFYNEAGQKFILTFRNMEKLKDIMVSMRMTNIVCHIDKEEQNGDESE